MPPAAKKNQNKTQPTKVTVSAFLKAVEPEQRRADAKTLHALLRRVTGEKARMWGTSIVGYGEYHYKYDSGREGDHMIVGFAPRKANMVLYIMPGFSAHAGLMKKLGKHKTGRSCLYVNKLTDIDMDVLEKLVVKSVAHMRKTYKV